MKRKPLSQRDFVAMLLAQGAVIPCGCCRVAITDPENIEREHLNELAISGDDSWRNQQLWHKRPCSHEKTNGTKATSLGSSKHVIAKAKRMNKPLSPWKQRIREHNAERRAWAKRIKTREHAE
jgi:hypothetical protein